MNQHDSPEAWRRLIPTDEPKEVTEVWESASQAMRMAWQANDQGRKRERNAHLQAMYRQLRALRNAGSLKERGNAKPGKVTSQLVRLGDGYARNGAPEPQARLSQTAATG
jgi:hypothetical protein